MTFQEFKPFVRSDGNRQHIRAAVQPNHAKAENSWMLGRTFQSASSYVDFLRALLCVHQELGLPAATLRQHGAGRATEEARISALQQDLGTDVEHEPPQGVMTESYAWGVGYALNGSSLGAAMLLKSRAIKPDWPSAYMRMSKDYAASGKLATFFRGLNGSAIDLEMAVSGATDVFEMLSNIRKAPVVTANRGAKGDLCN